MSIHIGARPGEVAHTVLLPGDPLRARFVAENYLEDVIQYNEIRGMLGFTGRFRGHRVSVQGTGMGIPSINIYAHELIRDYGARNLIRIGSSGSMQAHVQIRDVVLAMSASTDSSINRHRFGGADFAPTASFELFQKALAAARERGMAVKAGSVLTTDEFYQDDPEFWKLWAEFGVLCAEMETAGLYTVAAKHGVNALSILTISDSLVSEQSLSAGDRERTFTDMVEIALGILEQ